MLWLKFLTCSFIIVAAGSRLSAYAGMISERTGFSAGIMGALVLAVITSCPELVTSLTSITAAVNAPDLAAGDLLGANMYNMLTIALLGIWYGRGSLLKGIDRGNRLTAVYTLAMLGVILLFIPMHGALDLPLGIAGISFGSILIAAIYAAGAFIIYRHGTGDDRHGEKSRVGPALAGKFALSAVILVLTGIWLAHIGKNIADYYNMGEMYVGVILIALATTQPECVVSFAALKRNATSMAVGNLLGSNFFNLFIIAILDTSLRKGMFFEHVSRLNLIPAAVGSILTLISIIAMSQKQREKEHPRRISWDSAAIIALFFTGHILLFNLAR